MIEKRNNKANKIEEISLTHSHSQHHEKLMIAQATAVEK
jgi:predicted  nucleic acid-binding Zn ribbon protein